MRNHATHRSKLDKMITIQKIQFTGKTGEITDKTPPVKCKCVNEKEKNENEDSWYSSEHA